MDKFLAPSTSKSLLNASIKNGPCDLLTMMKSSNNEPNKASLNNLNNAWSTRERNINMTTIQCNEKSKKLNTDIRGWKVVDEKKVYTTFRNGKVISASGYEGFKLSSGDKEKVKPVSGLIKGSEEIKQQEIIGTKRKIVVDNSTSSGSLKQKLLKL